MVSNKIRDGLKGFARLDDEAKYWVVNNLDAIQDDIEKIANEIQESEASKALQKQVAKVLKAQIPQPYVFVSYSSKDKKFVRRLVYKLEQAGIKVWFDEVELKIGQSLIERLREAIDSVDFLIVVLSKNSISSPWVTREVDIAMNQEIKNKKIKVLPILKENVSLPGFLEGKLFLDFSTHLARSKSTQKLIEQILTYTD